MYTVYRCRERNLICFEYSRLWQPMGSYNESILIPFYITAVTTLNLTLSNLYSPVPVVTTVLLERWDLMDLLLLNFDHQSSHLGTIMMIISLRLGTIRILFIDEPLVLNIPKSFILFLWMSTTQLTIIHIQRGYRAGIPEWNRLTVSQCSSPTGFTIICSSWWIMYYTVT